MYLDLALHKNLILLKTVDVFNFPYGIYLKKVYNKGIKLFFFYLLTYPHMSFTFKSMHIKKRNNYLFTIQIKFVQRLMQRFPPCVNILY